MTLSKDDHDRIADAIRSAETTTAGEIVCVLAKSSSHKTAMPLLTATVAALILPWLLAAFTAMSIQHMLSLQVLLFLLVLLVFSFAPIKAALLPRRTRRAIAHRAAMEQFFSRGLARNKNHASVLIFVSLAERYARIVASDEAAASVAQSEWQAAVNALTAHMRDGRIADGFVSAINACGKVLARHFPRNGQNGAKLPDRIYVI